MRVTQPGAAGLVLAVLVAAAFLTLHPLASQDPALTERFARMSREAEARGLAEPYKGIVTSAGPMAGLFPIRSTGVSTEPVRQAAVAFLESLTVEQRRKTTFAVDDDEWRKWMNQHFYVRQGVSFGEMSEGQHEAAVGLLGASLSAKGLTLSRDIMRLNHTLGELTGGNFAEYGEGRYHLTVMGTPSSSEPWGWQLDGHHLNVNYFVLGDQVVMTPAFFGSEPVTATSGTYRGVSILQEEQDLALAFLRSLTDAQRAKAVLATSKTGNHNVGEAFRDNLVLDYAGLPARELSPDGQDRLLALIALYVGNMRDGHAKVKMEEVRAHLGDTHFAWIGGSEDDSVYYYRIHSPVVLIEFDHQRPIGLRHLHDPQTPMKDHIHTVTRTPNGNDYGKDLLRQHYERHRDDPSHGHAH